MRLATARVCALLVLTFAAAPLVGCATASALGEQRLTAQAVTIQSEPDGAPVFVNGRFMGTTPTKVQLPEPEDDFLAKLIISQLNEPWRSRAKLIFEFYKAQRPPYLLVQQGGFKDITLDAKSLGAFIDQGNWNPEKDPLRLPFMREGEMKVFTASQGPKERAIYALVIGRRTDDGGPLGFLGLLTGDVK